MLVKLICSYSSGICSILKASFLTLDLDELRNQNLYFTIFSMAFRQRLVILCGAFLKILSFYHGEKLIAIFMAYLITLC